MTLKDFVSKALAVPFVEKGRNYSGWDCWGCVRLCLIDVFGIELPEYLDYTSTKEYAQLNSIIVAAKAHWVLIPKNYKSGDVALFKISNQQTHVAVMVDNRYALHAEQKLGTFIEPIDSVIWQKRLEGVYRYAG